MRARLLRLCLRDGIDDGDLPGALDVDLAIAQLLGPLLYRRLASAEPLTPAVVAAVVDSFLPSPVPAGKSTPKATARTLHCR